MKSARELGQTISPRTKILKKVFLKEWISLAKGTRGNNTGATVIVDSLPERPSLRQKEARTMIWQKPMKSPLKHSCLCDQGCPKSGFQILIFIGFDKVAIKKIFFVDNKENQMWGMIPTKN